MADSTGGVFVWGERPTAMKAGDLVEIWGETRKSLRTVVRVTRPIEVLHHGVLNLPARKRGYAALLAGDSDCEMVKVRGIVRTASVEDHGQEKILQLQILLSGGLVQAYIQHYKNLDVPALMDAHVELTAVAGAAFNAVGQVMRPRLLVSESNALTVLQLPAINPWVLPLSNINEIEQSRFVEDRSRRVRMEGTVVAYDPGYTMVIENATGSLLVNTRQRGPASLGDVVTVTGFPDDHAYAAVLEDAQFRLTGMHAAVTAVPITYADAIAGAESDRLVELTGTVSSELHGELSDSMVIISDGHAVELVLQREARAPLPDLPVGTKVKAVGICRVTPSIEWKHPLLFRLDLRQGSDLSVVTRPSWLTVRHLFFVVAVLILTISSVLVWVRMLQRKVQAQTLRMRQAMLIEQERSSLLEHINSDMDVSLLLQRISMFITSSLSGARCSIRTMENNACPEKDGQSIPLSCANSYKRLLYDNDGKQLGLLEVARIDGQFLSEEAIKLVSGGADLATLALRQRRLLADLSYSSSHDALTGLPNRRCCDAHLDALLALRDKDVSIIYIDVNRFKAVNDNYGHSIGDLYLQALAKRFTSAVQEGDMLARIGGDEFMVITTSPRTTSDLKSYERVLAECFTSPFIFADCMFFGSASLGTASSPEDGYTRNELTLRADERMYDSKRLSAAVV